MKMILEGELIRKNVSHDSTVLHLERDDGEEIILILPCDLDDCVRVGEVLEIKIKQV